MNLKHLTDKALHQDLLSLVKRERETLTTLLWHLKEVDRRKLYSDHLCGGLFDYCVIVLKYSESQAARRVNACRMMSELPQITAKIENGDLNLTQLNQSKQFFKDERISDPKGKLEILGKIAGKTTRESEKILRDLKKDISTKKVCLWMKEPTLDELKKIQNLKAHSCPDMDALLTKMCHTLDSLWNPARREGKISASDSRYLSSGLKAEVWRRDLGKCRNCGSTRALEFDHIKPFALGGQSKLENLQLLCRNCNQRKSVT